jgi:hypothetical protein
MRMRLRGYRWSFVFALLLTLLCAGLASVPGWSAVGVLLAPGMLVAAIVFPTGINSSWPNTYLVLAALMNALVLAFPVLWLWKAIGRFRNRT